MKSLSTLKYEASRALDALQALCDEAEDQMNQTLEASEQATYAFEEAQEGGVTDEDELDALEQDMAEATDLHEEWDQAWSDLDTMLNDLRDAVDAVPDVTY